MFVTFTAASSKSTIATKVSYNRIFHIWRTSTDQYGTSYMLNWLYGFFFFFNFNVTCRYKNTMPDRYRDVAKCDRYLPPPHYLASGAPLVSTGGSITSNVVDTNSVNMYGNVVNRGLVGNTNNSIVTNSTENYLSGYLSSTVHTPVKRYIPSTNTIATDIYSDSTVVLPHHQQVISGSIYNSVSTNSNANKWFHTIDIYRRQEMHHNRTATL